MNDTSELLRPELLHSFGDRFDSGVIDLGDMDDIMFRAECVALDLRNAGLSADAITTPLKEVLRQWTPDLVDQFSSASDGAWDLNDEAEGALKAILHRIILAANGGGTLARTVTEEEYQRMNEAGTRHEPRNPPNKPVRLTLRPR